MISIFHKPLAVNFLPILIYLRQVSQVSYQEEITNLVLGYKKGLKGTGHRGSFIVKESDVLLELHGFVVYAIQEGTTDVRRIVIGKENPEIVVIVYEKFKGVHSMLQFLGWPT